MADEGLEPAVLYAFERLGYLVTEDNADQFTDDQLEAWDAAVAEFRRIHDCE